MRGFDWMRTLAVRLRALGGDRRLERDLNDELSFHMEMDAQTNLHRGMSRRDALRYARQTSGGIEQAKERHRDARAWRLARDLAQDVRYAWRSLRRAPAFTIVAVATLALGIGANAAMFSVLNTFLIRPLPYPQPDRLVRLFRTSIHSQSWPHSSANVLDYRQRNTVFDYVVPWNGLRQSLTGDGQAAEGLQGMSVTADFFPALGVPAAVGRWFTADEDQPGGNQVAVLSDGFWRRRFGADPTIVGRTLRLEGQPVTVVGVMPPGFEHPILWGPVDLWRPFAFTPQQRQARRQQLSRSVRPSESGRLARTGRAGDGRAPDEHDEGNRSEPRREPAARAAAAFDVRRSQPACDVAGVRPVRVRPVDRVRQPGESAARSHRRSRPRAHRSRGPWSEPHPAAAPIAHRKRRHRVCRRSRGRWLSRSACSSSSIGGCSSICRSRASAWISACSRSRSSVRC